MRVVLATVGAPHGVRGEVRVKSFTVEPEGLRSYGPLHTEDGRAFEIDRLRPLKDDMLVVKFRGVDDRDAAAKLTNLALGVSRDALPETQEDEFYLTDLIGLAVFDAAGNPAGTVTNVYNHGAGDILEIAPADGGRSALVPFTRESAPDIDIAGGKIVIVPPLEIDITEDNQEEP